MTVPFDVTAPTPEDVQLPESPPPPPPPRERAVTFELEDQTFTDMDHLDDEVESLFSTEGPSSAQEVNMETTAAPFTPFMAEDTGGPSVELHPGIAEVTERVFTVPAVPQFLTSLAARFPVPTAPYIGPMIYDQSMKDLDCPPLNNQSRLLDNTLERCRAYATGALGIVKALADHPERGADVIDPLVQVLGAIATAAAQGRRKSRLMLVTQDDGKLVQQFLELHPKLIEARSFLGQELAVEFQEFMERRGKLVKFRAKAPKFIGGGAGKGRAARSKSPYSAPRTHPRPKSPYQRRDVPPPPTPSQQPFQGPSSSNSSAGRGGADKRYVLTHLLGGYHQGSMDFPNGKWPQNPTIQRTLSGSEITFSKRPSQNCSWKGAPGLSQPRLHCPGHALSRPINFSILSGGQSRRWPQVHPRFNHLEQVHSKAQVSNGVHRGGKVFVKTRSMDGKTRPQGCVLWGTGQEGGQETPQVPLERRVVGDVSHAQRVKMCTVCVHKATQTHSGAPEKQGSTTNHISGRPMGNSCMQSNPLGTNAGRGADLSGSRIPNKLGEICTHSLSGDRVSGLCDQFSRHDIQYPSREEGYHQDPMQGVNLTASSSHQGPGQVAGYPTSSRQSASGSKVTLSQTSVLQNREYQGADGSMVTSSSYCQIQSVLRYDVLAHTGDQSRTSVVDRQHQQLASGSDSGGAMGSTDPHGCMPGGIWSRELRRSLSGSLGGGAQGEGHKSVRVHCSNKESGLLHSTSKGSQSQINGGQQISRVVHLQDGGNQVITTNGISPSVLGVSSEQGPIGRGGLHPIRGEQGSRPIIQEDFESLSGVVIRQGSIPGISGGSRMPIHRSICLSGQLPSASLHSMEERAGGSGRECISLQLGQRGLSLRIPEIQAGGKGPGQTENTPGRDIDLDCSSLEDEGLVSNSSGDASRPSNPAGDEPTVDSESEPGATPTAGVRQAKVSGMETFLEARRAEGFSEDACQILVKRWAPSTVKTYEGAWKRWYSWCTQRGHNPISPSIPELAEFLVQLHKAGSSYAYLGILRSTVSVLADPGEGGVRVGQDPRITSLFKGFYKLRPPRVRYTATWSVDSVLNFYQRVEIPNKELSLKEHTIKLAMLLGINLIARAGDLNCLLAENYVEKDHKIELLLAKTMKHQRSGPLKPVSIYVQENINICPVATLLSYIYRTREYRQRKDRKARNLLFLSLDDRHVNVTTRTISRWILLGMDKAGINIETFKAHSMRGASASTFRAKGMSLQRILKRGRWANRSVFKKHYLRNL